MLLLLGLTASSTKKTALRCCQWFCLARLDRALVRYTEGILNDDDTIY